jgi:DNA-binding CsgD family transcriptional regulator
VREAEPISSERIQRTMTKRPPIFDIGAGPAPGPVGQAFKPSPDWSCLPNELLGAIDLLSQGILIVDRDGRITFANRAAEDLLRLHNGLTNSAQPHSGILPGDDTRQRRLNQAIRNRIQTADDDYLTLQTHGEQPLLIVVFRSGPGSILFVSEPIGAQELDCRPMAGFYGLTRAETRLLDALLKGEKITAYARRARVTINTVKGHLSRLFRKTQTSRQSELVLRVLSNPLFRLLLVPAARPGA